MPLPGIFTILGGPVAWAYWGVKQVVFSSSKDEAKKKKAKEAKAKQEKAAKDTKDAAKAEQKRLKKLASDKSAEETALQSRDGELENVDAGAVQDLAAHKGKAEDLSKALNENGGKLTDDAMEQALQQKSRDPASDPLSKYFKKERKRRLRLDDWARIASSPVNWRTSEAALLRGNNDANPIPYDYSIKDLRKQYRKAKRLTGLLECLEGGCCGLGVSDFIGLIPCAGCFFLIPMHLLLTLFCYKTRPSLGSGQRHTLPLFSVLAGRGEPPKITTGRVRLQILLWQLTTDSMRALILPNLVTIGVRLLSSCLINGWYNLARRKAFRTKPHQTQPPSRPHQPGFIEAKDDCQYQYRRGEFMRRYLRERDTRWHQTPGTDGSSLVKLLSQRDRILAWRHRKKFTQSPFSQDVHWAREWQFSLQKRIEDQGYRLTNRERRAGPSGKKLALLSFVVLLPLLVGASFVSLYAFVDILGGSVTPQGALAACSKTAGVAGTQAAAACADIVNAVSKRDASSLKAANDDALLPISKRRRRLAAWK